MNTEQLRKKIMRRVTRSLNEAFAFESDPVGDDLLKIISNNGNVAEVVKTADENDWHDLVNKIKDLASGNTSDIKAPAKITNLDALAKFFIAKMSDETISALKKMDDSEIRGIIDYLNTDDDEDGDNKQKSIGYDGNSSKDNDNDSPFSFESKKSNMKECNGGNCGNNNNGKTNECCGKKTNESRNYAMMRRRHSMNESSMAERRLSRRLNECQDMADQLGNRELSRMLRQATRKLNRRG